MFSALLERASDNAKLRRPFMLLWRRAWRLQRATLATAGLVVRDDEGRVLVISDRDSLRLPFLELHGWDPITTQVEEWLAGLGETRSVALVAVDGAPGPLGVTFVYGAKYEGGTLPSTYAWLDMNVALCCLNEDDRRLLRLGLVPQNHAAAKFNQWREKRKESWASKSPR